MGRWYEDEHGHWVYDSGAPSADEPTGDVGDWIDPNAPDPTPPEVDDPTDPNYVEPWRPA